MEYDDESDMKYIVQDVTEFIQKASYQYDPMQIATAMLAQSLSLTKTMLSEEDFQKYVSFVYSNMHRVKPYVFNED